MHGSNNSNSNERLDTNALLEMIATAESADQATSAMVKFVAEGNPDALRLAIAIYTRSARARGKSVEKVLADLNGLSDQQRGRYQVVGRLLEPSELKRLVLDTVLEGFDAEGPVE